MVKYFFYRRPDTEETFKNRCDWALADDWFPDVLGLKLENSGHKRFCFTRGHREGGMPFFDSFFFFFDFMWQFRKRSDPIPVRKTMGRV